MPVGGVHPGRDPALGDRVDRRQSDERILRASERPSLGRLERVFELSHPDPNGPAAHAALARRGRVGNPVTRRARPVILETPLAEPGGSCPGGDDRALVGARVLGEHLHPGQSSGSRSSRASSRSGSTGRRRMLHEGETAEIRARPVARLVERRRPRRARDRGGGAWAPGSRTCWRRCSALRSWGTCDAKGMPNLLQTGGHGSRVLPTPSSSGPRPRAVQKALFAAIAPLAHAMGYGRRTWRPRGDSSVRRRAGRYRPRTPRTTPTRRAGSSCPALERGSEFESAPRSR